MCVYDTQLYTHIYIYIICIYISTDTSARVGALRAEAHARTEYCFGSLGLSVLGAALTVRWASPQVGLRPGVNLGAGNAMAAGLCQGSLGANIFSGEIPFQQGTIFG